MRVLVTGAAGFLGRHVVAEATARGHRVRALVRPAAGPALPAELAHELVEPARADLRAARGLDEVLAGVDVVVHTAASKSGDMYAQYAGTVVATENLLGAMDRAGVRAIVAISSFSVYDFGARWAWSRLDEASAVERDTRRRDEYCHTKLAQERLIRAHASARGWRCVTLRPGVIWGRGNLWTARLGARGERTWLRIGALAPLPLTYVENCAQAVVLAAERIGPAGTPEQGPAAAPREGLDLVLNVVDDERPPQARYARAVRAIEAPGARAVLIPWRVVLALAWAAVATNRAILGGRAKLPGVLVPARVHARFKPLRYDNTRIRRELGWRPRYRFAEALARVAAPPALSTGSGEAR
ncbi:MAG TPA: NAD(P)-dependent oxidoreductase [Phycisphaerales bacterium]|nr:NAD(P)-dependent oxidoreductase [Phycisphaerales bacterium]